MSLSTLRRSASSLLLLTLSWAAVPTTALAYDGGDLLDIAGEQGESLEQVREENSAGWMFEVIHWLASKTTPNASSTAGSDDPVLVAELIGFAQAVGYDGSQWSGNGFSSVRTRVVDVAYVGPDNYDIEFLAEYQDGDDIILFSFRARAEDGVLTIGLVE